MKKNKKIKDTTKFILALSICLALICTSVVFASVFSRQEDSAKAESVPSAPIQKFSQYSLPFTEYTSSVTMRVRSVTADDIVFVAESQYASLRTPRNFNFKSGHRYLLSFYLLASAVPDGTLQVSVNNGVREIGYFVSPQEISTALNVPQLFTYFFTPVEVGSDCMIIIYDNSVSDFVTYDMRFLNLFDCTDIFGVGNEPTTSSQFFQHLASQQTYPFYDGLPINNDYGLYTQILGTPAYNQGYNQGFTDGVDSVTSALTLPTPEFTLSGSGVTPPITSVSTSDSIIYSSSGSYSDVGSFTLNLNFSNDTYLLAHSTYQLFYDVSILPTSPLADVSTSPLSRLIYYPDNSFFSREVYFSDNSLNNYSYYNGLILNFNTDCRTLTLQFAFDHLTLFSATNIITISNVRVEVVEGMADAYQSGYDAGFTNGQTSGYNEGYTDGLATNDHTFLGLMGAVVDAPIQAVMNMFDFDILGMNMRGFYLSLFTLCLVITIVKFVLVK